MGKEWESLMIDLSNDNSLKGVVVTGAGTSFSAGGSLDFLMDRTETTSHNNQVIMRKFYNRILSFRNIVDVPFYAAINGHAIGAGLCLACACDIRIGALDAKLGLNFAKLGLHPGMGATHYFQHIVGRQMATKMLLTGELIDGEEAEKRGILLSAVDPDKVLEETLKLSRTIAQNPTVVVKEIVRTIRMQSDEGLHITLQREADSQAHTYNEDDLPVALSHLMEKSEKTK
eukprot:TRINITY_DN712_c0_g1_i1.p1 TRINITY_DN712_c0_g1~~TRINITY_DN712_c0_g1_i1.p1  ORF type:complete len:230 (+),score=50.18 TRINITY_DN712_c0_g1_i1:335-1024(+)